MKTCLQVGIKLVFGVSGFLYQIIWNIYTEQCYQLLEIEDDFVNVDFNGTLKRL